METLEQINEAPPRRKIKKLPKKKLMKKKASQSATLSKVWMYGDEDFEKVSGRIPVAFIEAYIEAEQADDYEEANKLISALAKNTSNTFANVFRYSFPYSDQLPMMKKVLAGGSGGFGETEWVAGYGPTKAKAKAEYDNMQDSSEAHDEKDWDY